MSGFIVSTSVSEAFLALRRAFRENGIHDKLGLVQWLRGAGLVHHNIPIDTYMLPEVQQYILQLAIGVAANASNLEIALVAMADKVHQHRNFLC